MYWNAVNPKNNEHQYQNCEMQKVWKEHKIFYLGGREFSEKVIIK